MSEDKLRVDVVSKTGKIWHGRASYVAIPAVDGSLGVLPGRQPVLAVLSPGLVEITRTGKDVVLIDVAQGFASVDQDVVTVVVDTGQVADKSAAAETQ